MFRRFLLFSTLLAIPGFALAQAPAAKTAPMPVMPAASMSAPATPDASTPATPVATPRPADAVNGLWVTPDGKSHVKIFLADDGTWSGKIVWLKEPNYPADYENQALAGKPKVDIHNPDESLRSRPLLGMVVLTDFKYFPKDKDWHDGKCYDPEEGKTYDCKMWLEDHGKTLKVRGYVWIFFKTQTWHRYQPKAASAPATSKQAR
ncbi:MAG: DUF2147 domain-containing protein [Gammaproteobacteria bacterium]|nr:DUF2147 domain-containing protein [Gammaproteobacteria bacterium]